jgi:hypothetical protein
MCKNATDRVEVPQYSAAVLGETLPKVEIPITALDYRTTTKTSLFGSPSWHKTLTLYS